MKNLPKIIVKMKHDKNEENMYKLFKNGYMKN